jgi:guanine deaminase
MILAGILLDDHAATPTTGWIAVDSGVIVDRGDGPPPPGAVGGEGTVITPGFIDAHLHLPQINSVGCDGLELLPWLERVIFPAESAWIDPEIARGHIDIAHRRLLRSGTVAYAGFLTSHATGVTAMAAATTPHPRALVGQVRMDRHAPDSLTHPGIVATPASTANCRWSINPRFAVSCSDGCLDTAADAARAAGERTFIQTHLAESRKECEFVRVLFPDDAHYTDVYDRFGLLTPHTLVAHGIHLAPEELEILSQRRAVVVHCPTANTFLAAGVFDLRSVREHGVRLALGTDIAGGPDVAMPRVARAMIDVAKLRRLTLDEHAFIPTPAEVWRLITRENAIAIGAEDLGSLDIGAAASVLLLRPDVPLDEHLYGRLLYNWNDDWIETMLLDGRAVSRENRTAR